jgi:hypothetical protein
LRWRSHLTSTGATLANVSDAQTSRIPAASDIHRILPGIRRDFMTIHQAIGGNLVFYTYVAMQHLISIICRNGYS